MAQAEVFEVATFYAHFDVVHEGDAAPQAVTVRVCDSLSCAMAGVERLIGALSLGPQVRVVRAPCVGRCDTAPIAEVGHYYIDHADAAAVTRAVAEHRHDPVVPVVHRSKRLSHRRRPCTAGAAPRRGNHRRTCDRHTRQSRTAWMRRRRISNRAQMAVRAGGAKPAADGGERR